MKKFNGKYKKYAMTMAEIIIVVVIVAIVAAVFLAMPKKNVSKMDRAKYYTAYNMLQQLQNEQLSNNGAVRINQNVADCPAIFANDCNFSTAVNEYLNTMADMAGGSVTLTNGMILSLQNTGSEDRDVDGIMHNYADVIVDIDGDENRVMNAYNREDVHKFRLFDDGVVEPCFIDPASADANAVCNSRVDMGDSGDNWIMFKVYTINSEGNISFVNDCTICKKTNGTPCTEADPNNVYVRDASCSNVSYSSARGRYLQCVNTANSCYMEANPPLK